MVRESWKSSTSQLERGDDPDVDSEACSYCSEWESFRQLMRRHYSHLTMRKMVKLLVTDVTLNTMFPQLIKLASIAAILPVSTAECERAFSAMKHIKTKLRNQMKISTLDYLMQISIEGPEIGDFNFEKAADIRGRMWNRRLSVGSSLHQIEFTF